MNNAIKGVLDISGTHDLNIFLARSIWFPKEKHLKNCQRKNDDDIKILGGTVQFDRDMDKDFQTKGKDNLLILFTSFLNQ
jgi:hypothetical protein